MTKTAALAAALLGLSAWLFLRRSDAVQTAEGEASQELPGALDIELPNALNQIYDMIQPTDQDQAARNLAAFLLTIRQAEGTAGPDGYRTMFGGRLFDSYADHPRVAHRFTNKAGQTLWTSAAGAYQFMAKSPIPGSDKTTQVNTWDRIAARLRLPDFSPASQDAAAIELVSEAGALGDVEAGRFDQAVSKVRRIWASLPGAGYAQPERSLESLRLAFLNAGGTLA
jgi:lysozyme